MDSAVQLPVTAAMQSVSDCFAGTGWDRGGAGMASEARLAAEPFGAGGPADDDRGGDGSDARLCKQLWGVGLKQSGELVEQLALFFLDLR